MGAQPGRNGFLAERLDRLFAAVHPADRSPYLLREVVAAVNESAGEDLLSVPYLSQLRRGERTEPSAAIVVGLARFFGVSPDYFFSDYSSTEADEHLEVAAAMRDHAVRQVALRAAGLSPGALRAILGMIDHARTVENLADADEQDSGPAA